MPEQSLYLAIVAVLVWLVTLAVARVLQRLLIGVAQPRPGHGMAAAGQVLATCIISGSLVAEGITGNLHTPATWLRDATTVGTFALIAVVLQTLAGWLGMKTLLGKRLSGAYEKGNDAAMLAGAGHDVGAALIVAHSVYGRDFSQLHVSIAFFALAQLAALALGIGFRALTRYDDAEQVVDGNVAAALSYVGVLLAASLLAGHAVQGDFTGWVPGLRGFVGALLFGVVLLPVRRWLVERFLLRGVSLDEAVARQRDVAAAAVECASYIAVALLLHLAGV